MDQWNSNIDCARVLSVIAKSSLENTILRYLSFLVMPGTKQQTICRKKRKSPVRHCTDPPASGPALLSSSSEASTSVPQSPITSPATSTPAPTQLTPSATHTSTPKPSSASATTPLRPTASDRKLSKSSYLSLGVSGGQVDLDSFERDRESLSGVGSRLIELQGL